MTRDLMKETDEPGKFEGEPLLTEILWDLGGDEDLGDSESFGFYALYLGLTAKEVGGSIGSTRAAILHEGSQGFVTGSYYDSDADAQRAWEALERDYDEFLGESEDDDDE
jgi:hypothetical protein